MGNCLSRKPPPTDSHKKDPNLTLDPNGTAAPPPFLSPPPPEEEAVVKEVLAETAMPPSRAPTMPDSKRTEDFKAKSPAEDEAAAVGDDGSEAASEICSVSECFSVSTTLTEKRGGGAEGSEIGEEETSASATKWWHPEWSPAGKNYYPQRSRSAAGEVPKDGAAASHGGGTRSSASPVKRPGGMSFTGREPMKGRQNGNVAADTRRDHGDRSGRRSVSPAAGKRVAELRAAGGGGGGVSKSPSARKAGMSSPRRAHPSSGASAARGLWTPAAVEEEQEVGRAAPRSPALPPPTGQKESVEYPLVSLECFIFL